MTHAPGLYGSEKNTQRDANATCKCDNQVTKEMRDAAEIGG